MRRNPDVLGTVVTGVIIIGAAYVGVQALKSTSASSGKSTTNWFGIPGLPVPQLQVPQVGLPGQPGGIGGPSSDAWINTLIDGWFNKAGGFFGIGSYDPTNWNSFVTTTNQYAISPVQFPVYPTAYFMYKVNQYTGYSKPGGLGY